jgi:hypothetical protein
MFRPMNSRLSATVLVFLIVLLALPATSRAFSWTVELNAGWNDIAVPLELPFGYRLSDFINEAVAQGVDVEFMARYRNGQWIVFSPAFPFNDLEMELGKGYWAFTRRSGWFEVTGDCWCGVPPTPTNTPIPPTDTPIPPTDTPAPPTDTPLPPTETPIPPTDTPIPPTDTPAPPTETPTFTVTPTPTGERSITVLKLHADTWEPLDEWFFTLYFGDSCVGRYLDRQSTRSDGLANFAALYSGEYSVEEDYRSGWQRVDPVCQVADLRGPYFGDAPRPDTVFPRTAGVDQYDSGMLLDIELTGHGRFVFAANGLSRLWHSERKQTTVCGVTTYFIDLEMQEMSLSGASPHGTGTLTLRADPVSTGDAKSVEEGRDLPAQMTLRLHPQFEFAGLPGVGPLIGELPLRLNGRIGQWPPLFWPLRSTPQVITLRDAGGNVAGYLHRAIWMPIDNGGQLLVYRNRPGDEPTATPVPTETPEPTETPRPTETPEPPTPTTPPVEE